MENFEIITFSGDDKLAQAVASAWLGEVEAANRAGKTHCVALSGGRIARKFFAAAAVQAQAGAVSLRSVHFFWADERCVPPDDVESNYRLARELLFAPLGIADAQIHRIRGEEAPELAAREAEAEICRIGPLNSDGRPVLDLIFIGMGEDGHVASLFPGEPEAMMSSQAVYRAVTATKLPPRRITLGYHAIAAARQVWVLASGPGKEAALRESLRPGGQTPLARVLGLSQRTKVFTDIRAG
jgi:6-phosphogluconolactonase